MDEYLKRFTDRINGVTLGVGKTQAPKATLDGFEGNDGTWNSVIKNDRIGESYRERVETLIFSGDTVYLAFMPDGSYKIPGGGTEPGISMEETAVKECQEEAFITPKNIGYVGSYGKKDKVDNPDSPYNGNITHLFVGEFGSEYRGTVHDADLDPKIRNAGRFYEIDQVYDRLSVFHRRTIDNWRSNRIATESVYYYEMTAKERNALPDSEFGIPSRRAFPLNDVQHVKSAIMMFRHCPEKERAGLAKRIFAKYREFNLDVRISKKNPLWKYAKKATGIVTEGVEFVPEGSTRLDSFKQVAMSVATISRYAPVCPKLTDLRFGNDYSGYIWLDGSVVVGYIHVSLISGEKWLTALEVEPEYQNQGLEPQMVKVAATELGATRSRINEEGTISRLAMEELGFEPSDPYLPVDNSYEDVPGNDSFVESILEKLDAEWDTMMEAPEDGTPIDYTADVEDDPDAADDDFDLSDELDTLDDDFDNLSGENDDIDEDPTDYTDDMESPADDDDDMEGDSTDYTGDVDDPADDDDDLEGDSTDYTADMEDGPDEPAEAEAPEEPAGEEDPDEGEPTEEAPGDDAGDDAPAAEDNPGDDNPPADDAPDEGGDAEGGDDAATDDDADMGEPTDYTDDTETGDDAGGDDTGDAEGGDEGGGDAGGEDSEMSEDEIEDTRQSLEIYRNLQDLHDSIEGYMSRLDAITISTTNSSVVIQGVKNKFNEILDLLNDYMVTKFTNDSLVEQTETYTKFIVSTKMAIDLLKNNQAYLKQ